MQYFIFGWYGEGNSTKTLVHITFEFIFNWSEIRIPDMWERFILFWIKFNETESSNIWLNIYTYTQKRHYTTNPAIRATHNRRKTYYEKYSLTAVFDFDEIIHYKTFKINTEREVAERKRKIIFSHYLCNIRFFYYFQFLSHLNSV